MNGICVAPSIIFKRELSIFSLRNSEAFRGINLSLFPERINTGILILFNLSL